MDINEILQPLRRWWWLLLLTTVIAATSSYFVSLQQPPMYQSRATLMIGRTINNPNPTSVEISLEQQLAITYANIANREPLRDATKQALGLNWLPDYTVSVLPNTQLIEVVVSDTDPQRAQIVAYEISSQLIERSPTTVDQEDQEQQAFIREQLDILQGQITETQDEIANLKLELGELTSAREIADTQSEIQSLQNVLSSLQSNYANLLSNSESGAINTLTMIEEPNLPTRPVGSQQLLTVGLSAAVGFSLAAAAAYLLEYLDKTVKTEEEIKRITKAPILGHIPAISKETNKWTFVSQQPRSPTADAFRTLRTNIDLLGSDLRTVLVTSTAISEGKSTVSMNLAQIATQAKKKVILVEADMRKPIMKKALKLKHNRGLSDILNGKLNIKEGSFQFYQNNLILIPSGKHPPNPTELLGSDNMSRMMSNLKDMADLVIIDGPPLFVTDAIVLAKKSDGVLLVVQLGQTRRDALKLMVDQVNRTGTSILGVVINNVSRSSRYYSRLYGGYYEIPEPDDEDVSEESEEGVIETENERVLDFG